LVAEHGLDLLPIRGDAQTLVTCGGTDMLAMVRSFRTLAESYAQDLYALIPALQDTDLLLNQLPLALYGYDLAQKLGVLMLVVAVMPLTRTSAFPVMGFPTLPIPAYNRLTYHLAEQVGWQVFRPTINRWRRQVLGLPAASLLGYFRQLGTRRCPTLNGFSARVVPRPADWGEHVHVTGYWFPEDEHWQPPDDLLAFIRAGPPPVFVGFGSMPVRNPAHTTQVILEALRRTGQRAILHAGWAGMGELALPDYAFRISYAPYGWLFPRMAMVIHHGASGTTAFGLRAGVPSLAVPFMFDQFYWGERIAALGVGPKAIPYRRLSVDRLAQAIAMATTDPQMRERAAELGRQICAEKGIDATIAIIERYAADRGAVNH
jgi:UDP:flavonoid glycosyltransferase YjiC (YdhE family)